MTRSYQLWPREANERLLCVCVYMYICICNLFSRIRRAEIIERLEAKGVHKEIVN
jgi:hypothetical protein